MRSFKTLAFLGLVVAVATPVRAAELSTIPEVLPDESGVTTLTLTVDAARLDVADAFSFTTRAYHHGGEARIMGPTIVVQAGGSLNLTLVNHLADDSAVDATKAINTFRHSNTTNLHTHGLHVTPEVDSVFRHASPGGGTLHYDLPIPSDHAPGMHWYHAHTHGSSTMQIMGGLVGGLYVQAQARDNIPTEISSLTNHRLVMQLINFEEETEDGVTAQSCTRGQPGFNSFTTHTFSQLESESGSTLAADPTYAGTERTFFLINGQYLPTVTVAPGESRLFQFVYAAGSKNPVLIFPSTCTVQHIASDGVYFNGAPRTVTYLQMVTATRAEFVMTCDTAGTHTVNYAVNGQQNSMTTTGGTPLFSIEATGTTQTSATLPTTLTSITRPAYLTDLQSLTSTDVTFSMSMAQRGADDCKFVMGLGSDCSDNNNCAYAEFAGERGLDASNHLFSMRVGQTAEWVLHGRGAVPHPLHIHINHFQIISYSGSDTNLNYWVQVGDWRDTIPVLDGQIVIRFPAADISGETILHCHELSHEDRGLMNSFLIEPGETTTTTTTTTTESTTTTPASTTSTAASTTESTTTTTSSTTTSSTTESTTTTTTPSTESTTTATSTTTTTTAAATTESATSTTAATTTTTEAEATTNATTQAANTTVAVTNASATTNASSTTVLTGIAATTTTAPMTSTAAAATTTTAAARPDNTLTTTVTPPPTPGVSTTASPTVNNTVESTQLSISQAASPAGAAVRFVLAVVLISTTAVVF